jgi:hypothetical protein
MGPGDANCDEGINSADLPAMAAAIAGGEIGECADADGNCDDALDEEDVDVILRRMFGAAAPPLCVGGS